MAPTVVPRQSPQQFIELEPIPRCPDLTIAPCIITAVVVTPACPPRGSSTLETILHDGQSRVLVIIPAFNEAASVARVVHEVVGQGFDAVVVDDGSADATAVNARAAGAPVLRLPVNVGVGAALRCGFRYAVRCGYGIAVQCDGDGQHPAPEIHKLLDVMHRTGAHLVIGTRFEDGKPLGSDIPRHRRFAMALLARLVRRLTGQRLTDTTSGFRAIREPLLSQFAARYPAQYLGDTFEALIAAHRGGYQLEQAKVEMRKRETGVASASPLASVLYIVRAVLSVILRTEKRLQPLPPAGNGSP